jgi:hypothetical protein
MQGNGQRGRPTGYADVREGPPGALRRAHSHRAVYPGDLVEAFAITGFGASATLGRPSAGGIRPDREPRTRNRRPIPAGHGSRTQDEPRHHPQPSTSGCDAWSQHALSALRDSAIRSSVVPKAISRSWGKRAGSQIDQSLRQLNNGAAATCSAPRRNLVALSSNSGQVDTSSRLTPPRASIRLAASTTELRSICRCSTPKSSSKIA